MSLMQKLVSELQAIDPEKVRLTAGSVKAEDTVIGTVTGVEIKRLYGLRQKLAAQADGIHTGHEAVGNHDDKVSCRKAESRIQYFKTLALVVNELLWLALMEQWPELHGKPSIGLRAGWQVVWSKKTSSGVIDMTIVEVIPVRQDWRDMMN